MDSITEIIYDNGDTVNIIQQYNSIVVCHTINRQRKDNMENETVFQRWGRNIKNSKREERGALDIVITKEPDAAFPDERVIDIVYHKTDVGLKFYLSRDVEQFFQALDMAEEFCMGYNQALDDMKTDK